MFKYNPIEFKSLKLASIKYRNNVYPYFPNLSWLRMAPCLGSGSCCKANESNFFLQKVLDLGPMCPSSIDYCSGCIQHGMANQSLSASLFRCGAETGIINRFESVVCHTQENQVCSTCHTELLLILTIGSAWVTGEMLRSGVVGKCFSNCSVFCFFEPSEGFTKYII